MCGVLRDAVEPPTASRRNGSSVGVLQGPSGVIKGGESPERQPAQLVVCRVVVIVEWSCATRVKRQLSIISYTSQSD